MRINHNSSSGNTNIWRLYVNIYLKTDFNVHDDDGVTEWNSYLVII